MWTDAAFEQRRNGKATSGYGNNKGNAANIPMEVTDKTVDVAGSQGKLGKAFVTYGTGNIRAGNDVTNAASGVRAQASVRGPGSVDPDTLVTSGKQLINEGDKLKRLGAPLNGASKIFTPVGYALDVLEFGGALWKGVADSDLWVPVRSGVKIGVGYVGGALGGTVGFTVGGLVGIEGAAPVTAPLGAGLGGVAGNWAFSSGVQAFYDSMKWE